MSNIYVALVHHPVYNKKKEVVTTSVTTLDVHDISRISRTYGIVQYFLVTPLESHKALVNKMINHWTNGHGAIYNPNRKEALTKIKVMKDLDEVTNNLKSECGNKLITVATCAKEGFSTITFNKLKEKLLPKQPCLIIFGTGWGLTDEVLGSVDYVLEPISGLASYNHLPVRSAVAIILDRLLAR